METSLHRELKNFYAGEDARTEVRLGKYRIDVVRNEELIEIQHGSLAALRDKVRALTADYDVRVVKPIVVRKTLVKLASRGGKVVERRTSPKRGKLLDVFDELIYWRRVFPHSRLTLEVVLVDMEELRFPGRNRRRRWRRRNEYEVEDQKLVCVHETFSFRLGADLIALLPVGLPVPFHSGHVAAGLGIPRSVGQRIVYCLREMGLLVQVGKERNARLYGHVAPSPTPPPSVKKTRRKRAA
ncbi:MAG: hypothetical protein JNL96_28340 [Planctomycetaceae bacterium]|nr:hypothetical protein [Planctomycetaceae bacterium]